MICRSRQKMDQGSRRGWNFALVGDAAYSWKYYRRLSTDDARDAVTSTTGCGRAAVLVQISSHGCGKIQGQTHAQRKARRENDREDSFCVSIRENSEQQNRDTKKFFAVSSRRQSGSIVKLFLGWKTMTPF
jgi:hypothetical protein